MLNLLALVLLSHSALAADRALIFGSTFDHRGDLGFMTSAFGAADGLRKQGWEIEFHFGGDDIRLLPRTDSLCVAQPSNAKCCLRDLPANDARSCDALHDDVIGSLTSQWGFAPGEIKKATTQALYDSLTEALVPGPRELKKDDQLLLETDTHGSRSFFFLADGTISYGDPRLLKLLDALHKKGVKMGFLLNSCYSGGGVEVWSPYGCAVSIASADTYGTPGGTIVWSDLLRGTTDRIGDVEATHAPSRPYEAFSPSKIALIRRDGSRAISLEDVFLLQLFEDWNLGSLVGPQMSGLNPKGVGELPLSPASESDPELEAKYWPEILSIFNEVGSSLGSEGASSTEPMLSWIATPELKNGKIILPAPVEYADEIDADTRIVDDYERLLGESRRLIEEYLAIGDLKITQAERQAKWDEINPRRDANAKQLAAAEYLAVRVSLRARGYLGERLAFERARRLIDLRIELSRYAGKPIPEDRQDLSALDRCEQFVLMKN